MTFCPGRCNPRGTRRRLCLGLVLVLAGRVALVAGWRPMRHHYHRRLLMLHAAVAVAVGFVFALLECQPSATMMEERTRTRQTIWNAAAVSLRKTTGTSLQSQSTHDKVVRARAVPFLHSWCTQVKRRKQQRGGGCEEEEEEEEVRKRRSATASNVRGNDVCPLFLSLSLSLSLDLSLS